MYLQHDVWLSLHFTRVGLTASQIQTEYYKSYIALHSCQLCNRQIVIASITHKLICNLFISWQNSILSAPTNSTTTVDTHLTCKSTITKYKKTNVQATVLMATSAGFPGLATVVVPEVWNSVAIFNSSSTFKRLFSQKYCTPNTDIFYCHMQNTPN